MESVKDFDFSDHVIFILRCDADAASGDGDTVVSGARDFGLYSFVSPLRSSSLPSAALKDIVFYTEVGAVKAEWKNLAHFPRLFIYPVSQSVTV